MTSSFPTGVLIVTCEYPPFPGGIGAYAGALAGATAVAGFEVMVIAPEYPDLAPIEGAAPVRVHRVLGHHRVPIDQVAAMLKIIAQVPADWPILAVDIRSVLVLWATRFLHRRVYRAMIHGSEVSKFTGGGAMARIARRAYGLADAICTNSRATLDIFQQAFGAPRSSRVTYLGVDPFWSQAATGAFDNPDLAVLPADRMLICAVGRIEPRKGHVETVRALALARDRHGLELPLFVVAGRPESDDHAERLRAEARTLQVPLLLTGPVSNLDLRRLYGRARAHTLFAQALPGKVEGFGLVLLEAAAQGCPSIATAVGGIPEVMGRTGTVIPPDDVAAFAKAIAATLSRPRDPQVREDLRRHAAGFDWRVCAQQTFPELNWSASSRVSVKQ